MANQTKSINETEALASQPSSLNFLVENGGGGVKRLAMSKLTVPKAEVADAVATPVYTYSGSTIADFKQWLKDRNAEDTMNFRQFHASINPYQLDHFSDNDYECSSSGAFRCAFTRVAFYAGSDTLFSYMITSGSADLVYFVRSNSEGIMTCYKVNMAKC